MVGAVVGILVTLIVAILVFYNIAGSIDTSSVDDNVAAARGYTLPGAGVDSSSYNNSADATNATDAILDQAGTFYSIAPIIAIVVVAVVILGYVGRLG